MWVISLAPLSGWSFVGLDYMSRLEHSGYALQLVITFTNISSLIIILCTRNDMLLRRISSSLKAKFHYAVWFEACRRPASNQLRTSFEPASVMEFGFKGLTARRGRVTVTLKVAVIQKCCGVCQADTSHCIYVVNNTCYRYRQTVSSAAYCTGLYVPPYCYHEH